jgi:myo-inositol-1(or 4)-monophosphatase
VNTIVRTTPTAIDLDQALAVGLKACKLGREVLLQYIGNLQHIEEKFQAGLVSEADKESERVISEHLRKNFPSIEFLGEESSFEGAKVQLSKAGPQGRWVVDPLDGTTNYIHQFPIFCISLALEINGEIQVAVIDCPKMGETYTAIKGRGAFVNGKSLKVSGPKKLNDAFLSTGFVADKKYIIEEQLRIFSDVVYKCRAVRRPGAAAYDLALIARGVFDGYWERNLQPWDSAAGLLLVEEAGGKVVSYRGNRYNPYMNSIVAGSPQVVDELLTLIQSHISKDALE